MNEQPLSLSLLNGSITYKILGKSTALRSFSHHRWKFQFRKYELIVIVCEQTQKNNNRMSDQCIVLCIHLLSSLVVVSALFASTSSPPSLGRLSKVFSSSVRNPREYLIINFHLVWYRMTDALRFIFIFICIAYSINTHHLFDWLHPLFSLLILFEFLLCSSSFCLIIRVQRRMPSVELSETNLSINVGCAWMCGCSMGVSPMSCIACARTRHR